jgi:GNAT superfamily N-acetyltransferase
MQPETICQIIRLRRDNVHLLKDLDALHRAFFQGSSVPPEQFMDFVTKRLGDEAMLLILGIVEDVPISYGLAFDVAEHPFMPEWQRSGYITQLYVAPEHRRRGIGRELVEFIFDWLASRGVTNVLLNVIAGESTAEQFWRAQGFTPRRTRMGRSV